MLWQTYSLSGLAVGWFFFFCECGKVNDVNIWNVIDHDEFVDWVDMLAIFP